MNAQKSKFLRVYTTLHNTFKLNGRGQKCTLVQRDTMKQQAHFPFCLFHRITPTHDNIYLILRNLSYLKVNSISLRMIMSFGCSEFNWVNSGICFLWTQFDIWKLIKRSDTSNPYALTLRYRSDGKKQSNNKRQRNTTVSRRRRRRGRPESGTESDSGDSERTSNTDFLDNDAYFKEDYDFDGKLFCFKFSSITIRSVWRKV